MTSLHTQIETLDRKVDALHTLIERLSANVNYLLEDSHSHSAPVAEVEPDHFPQEISALDALFEHQDILLDRDLVSRDRVSADDTQLTPEAQIQRLTAQLTASYNRIAALEEQLLSRSNSNYRQL